MKLVLKLVTWGRSQVLVFQGQTPVNPVAPPLHIELMAGPVVPCALSCPYLRFPMLASCLDWVSSIAGRMWTMRTNSALSLPGWRLPEQWYVRALGHRQNSLVVTAILGHRVLCDIEFGLTESQFRGQVVASTP